MMRTQYCVMHETNEAVGIPRTSNRNQITTEAEREACQSGKAVAIWRTVHDTFTTDDGRVWKLDTYRWERYRDVKPCGQRYCIHAYDSEGRLRT